MRASADDGGAAGDGLAPSPEAARHIGAKARMIADPVSLLDYAPEDTLIVVEDWAELRDTIAGIEEGAIQSRVEKIASQQLSPDH